MDRRFVSALRARGLDVVTVGDIETTGSSDGDQLQLATELRRVLYTFNVGDFCQLHSQWMQAQRSHNGIVISSQDYSVGTQTPPGRPQRRCGRSPSAVRLCQGR
ncbi:MAG: DUF5615 family PIN-like protein [Nodosilinea sp.]